MASLLDFVNRVRTIKDLDELQFLMLDGTVTDDVYYCLLGTAIEVPVVSSPGDDGGFEMQFPDAQMARTVGVVMYLEWDRDRHTVRLPEPVSDVVVAAHFEFVRSDCEGRFIGWLLPTGDREHPWVEMSPTDENLLPDAQWCLRESRPLRADEMSAGESQDLVPATSSWTPRYDENHQLRTAEGTLLTRQRNPDPGPVYTHLADDYLIAYRAVRATTLLLDLVVRRLDRTGWRPQQKPSVHPAGDKVEPKLSYGVALYPPGERWWAPLGAETFFTLSPRAEVSPSSPLEPTLWTRIWFPEANGRGDDLHRRFGDVHLSMGDQRA
jgi:hypothetical protein